MVIPEPCTGLRRRNSAAIYGWDRPLLTFIYPGFDCGSNGLTNLGITNPCCLRFGKKQFLYCLIEKTNQCCPTQIPCLLKFVNPTTCIACTKENETNQCRPCQMADVDIIAYITLHMYVYMYMYPPPRFCHNINKANKERNSGNTELKPTKPGSMKKGDHILVAVDLPAKSLTFLGFSGKPLDFPNS